MKDKLDVHNSYITTYRMYKERERELHFPLTVSVSYQNAALRNARQQRRVTGCSPSTSNNDD